MHAHEITARRHSVGEFVGGGAMGDSGVGLVWREHRTRDLRAIHALECDEVAAGVDDGNRHEDALVGRATQSCRTHAPREIQIHLEAIHPRHAPTTSRARPWKSAHRDIARGAPPSGAPLN